MFPSQMRRKLPEIVRSLMHIDGARGLTINAAGGTLVDGRTSTATYIDADGVLQTAAANEIVLENNGLRHEGAITNYFLQSEVMDSISWGKTFSAVTVNAIAAPDGATTADKLKTTTDSGEHSITQAVSIVSGETWTQYFFAKAGEETIAFASFTTSGFSAPTPSFFDLTNGTETPGANVTATITPLADGWYLCRATKTATSTNALATFRIGLTKTTSSSTSTGANATDGLYLWGFNCKKSVSSYIPTTVAAVTRATDSLSLPVVQDTNFYQAQGITLIKCKMKFANSAGNKAILAINTGATDFIYDNGSGGIALADGTNTATAAVGGWEVDDTLLIAACRNKRDGKMSVHVSKNGGAWTDSTDTTYDGSVSAGSNILLASGNTDSIEFNHVKLYKSTKSFAAMQRWIKSRAARETS